MIEIIHATPTLAVFRESPVVLPAGTPESHVNALAASFRAPIMESLTLERLAELPTETFYDGVAAVEIFGLTFQKSVIDDALRRMGASEPHHVVDLGLFAYVRPTTGGFTIALVLQRAELHALVAAFRGEAVREVESLAETVPVEHLRTLGHALAALYVGAEK